MWTSTVSPHHPSCKLCGRAYRLSKSAVQGSDGGFRLCGASQDKDEEQRAWGAPTLKQGLHVCQCNSCRVP